MNLKLNYLREHADSFLDVQSTQLLRILQVLLFLFSFEQGGIVIVMCARLSHSVASHIDFV